MIILTTSLGVLAANDKKLKMQIFSELYEFNERLIVNMKYGKRSIDSLVSEFKYMSEFLKGKRYFSGKENDFINDYLKNLGQSDAPSQIDYLNEKKNYIKKYKDESYDNYKKYASLYIKIFLMVGILIAVLLA